LPNACDPTANACSLRAQTFCIAVFSRVINDLDASRTKVSTKARKLPRKTICPSLSIFFVRKGRESFPWCHFLFSSGEHSVRYAHRVVHLKFFNDGNSAACRRCNGDELSVYKSREKIRIIRRIDIRRLDENLIAAEEMFAK